jgi:hypothetical protein
MRRTLTENSGTVIPGATVNVEGNGVHPSAGTQSAGSFIVLGLPRGDYAGGLSFPGFHPVNWK